MTEHPPTPNDLPPPPTGKTGWPWTVASAPLPPRLPSGEAWPRVSLVTPSFNQAAYLEETIRSVLLQGYPDLEYMVVDGGSADGSVEIMRRYEPWLAYAVSEKDRGQAHAINKGLARVTGSLFNWINSDDLLLPGALAKVAAAHVRSPQALIAGDVQNFADGEAAGYLTRQADITARNMIALWRRMNAWHQPGLFVPTATLRQAGHLDEDLRFAFDRDWLCRLLLVHDETVYLRQPIARFRLHRASKTVSAGAKWTEENRRVSERYQSALPPADRRYLPAAFELMAASFYVSFFYLDNWHAPSAWQHLRRAVRFDRRALARLKFWQLGLRLFIPPGLARLVRTGLLRARRIEKLG